MLYKYFWLNYMYIKIIVVLVMLVLLMGEKILKFFIKMYEYRNKKINLNLYCFILNN